MNAQDIFFGKELFMERFTANVSRIADNAAIIDADSGESITYKELDILSGKVYRFLSESGIGKENMVMIALPRGIAPFIAAIGTWKAGAAFTLLENSEYSDQNEAFIYQDCHCKLLINQEVFDQMMKTETKSGFEPANQHDLAYVVYTSGTMGHPKGVLQEFGTVNLCIFAMCLDGKALFNEGDPCALVTPLNFVATHMTSQAVLYYGATLVVTPLSYLRNPHVMVEKSREYHIIRTFMIPSLFKLYAELYSGYELIFVGAEPLRGIYKKDTDCVSVYTQSEAGYSVALFMLDQVYETAPLGKNPIDDKLTFVVDDRGDVLRGEGVGELCYWNPFFRGYIGQEELTKSVTDGNIVHSGDMVKQTADGTLFYQCRKDDMVKVNGNRVEPSEIEEELRQLLGVKWVAVREFTDQDKSLLCAYYIGEPKTSIEKAKELLGEKLASYKIPGFFMQIEEIPLNANGKFSLHMLPEPSIKQQLKEYKTPSTKIEQEICAAMAKVLGVESFGATNDFYEAGGDSVRSIRLIMELGWEKLEATMIFHGRTPERIAQLYEKAMDNGSDQDAEIRNKRALLKEYPLMPEQQYIVDYEKNIPRSTAWNLSLLLSFPKEIDTVRVQSAVLEMMKNHPVFSLVYSFNENEELVQRFVPDSVFSLEIEKTTEAEFAAITPTLVQPFELLDSLLYRVKLFETEKKKYLFMDMHHSIVDAKSLHVIMDDIQRAYSGKPLKEDFYFLNLEERQAETDSSLYEEGRAYYVRTLDQYDWERYPTIDEDSEDSRYGCVESIIPITQREYDAIYENYGIGKNAFYIAVILIAISSYNQKNNVRTSWVFHGRGKVAEQHIVGVLYKEFQVGIHIEEQMTLKEFFAAILKQIQMSLKYSCYPYPVPDGMPEERDDASLLYQDDMYTSMPEGELDFTSEELPVTKSVTVNLLDIEIYESDDGCTLFMEYNRACYKEESMNRFSSLMIHKACLLMKKMYDPQCTMDEIVGEI